MGSCRTTCWFVTVFLGWLVFAGPTQAQQGNTRAGVAGPMGRFVSQGFPVVSHAGKLVPEGQFDEIAADAVASLVAAETDVGFCGGDGGVGLFVPFVIPGSAVELVAVGPGDQITADVHRIGEVSAVFAG